jgi:sarcosine oxidase subunit beta
MKTTDAVIIGAGVIGASIAYELAPEGSRVICIDRVAAVTSGSSGSSSAVGGFHYSSRDEELLHSGGPRFWSSGSEWEAQGVASC